MLARVGKAAPDFEAAAFVRNEFRQIKLSDYKGHWIVVWFYPGDFSFVCPTELAAVALRQEELKGLDVQVLTVSTDSTYVHQAWNEAELSKMVPGGLPFPMVADAGGKIGRMYGVYDEDESVDLRGRFLIDPDFNIRSMELLSLDVGRNPLELIRQIKAYRYVSSTGRLAPAGWKPGQEGLAPGPELVGKVWQSWKP